MKALATAVEGFFVAAAPTLAATSPHSSSGGGSRTGGGSPSSYGGKGGLTWRDGGARGLMTDERAASGQ